MAPIVNPFDDPFRSSVDDLFDAGEEPNDGSVGQDEEQSYDEFAESHGLSSTKQLRRGTSTVEALLRQRGIDVENPTVQLLIQSYGDMLKDPQIGPLIIEDWASNPDFQAVPQQDYDLALMQSGFSGEFTGPEPAAGASQLAAHEGFAVAQLRNGAPKYEENPDTGWLRYKNGVLVSPDGKVAFDPTSKAPGSVAWQREVVANWGTEQVQTWAERLTKMGYLPKGAAKKATAKDPAFLGALEAYHLNRYKYGKPVNGELTGISGAAGSTKPPLVDFEEMQAQTRNFVRETYRRVYGQDPTDGEVVAMTQAITDQAMELQRRFRRKGYGNAAGLAATEAEERYTERVEQSPEAVYLREQDEENTRMRDALQRAVVVTNSLGG